MKIMVVDDHNGMRSMLCGFLKETDIELKECTDGAQAIEAYENFKPDWVIMDGVMKGLDGLTATQRLRSAFPQARVLLMSEETNPQLCRAAREAGATGFVTKGYLLERLSHDHSAALNEAGTLWMTSESNPSESI